MKRVVFYSWQSDLPNATNRGFIQQALETAAKQIAADNSVSVEPVIDRDTQGVAGSPDIAVTIFAKIASADVFIADISIISKPRKGRATPNPNVLIELGYALRALEADRVLLVFNETFGKISDLPFDLKMRRIITYTMPEQSADRASERKILTGKLDAAIRAALAHTTAIAGAGVSATMLAVTAIENAEAKRVPLIRKAVADILSRIDASQPKLPRNGGTIDDILAAIAQTQEAVADTAKLAEAIAAMDDEDSALEVYRWFGKLLERYDLPPNFSGSFNRGDFDYFKFVGHEMFVGLVATCLRDGRWKLLRRFLDETIPVRYVRRDDGPGSVYWDKISDYLPMIMGEGDRRQRLSLHADLLNERHSQGALAAMMPMQDFAAADLFLFFRTQGDLEPNGGNYWRPWSAIYLDRAPIFIRAAERTVYAAELLKAIGAADVPDLKARLTKTLPLLRQLFQRGFWTSPVTAEDIQRIGTK